MTVDLEKLVSENEGFQENQLKQFELFVNTSLALKHSGATVQQSAEQTYTTMRGQVQQLVNDSSGGDSNGPCPLFVLQRDKAYITLLETVTIPPKGATSTQQLSKFTDRKMQQIEQEMQQRQGQVGDEW